MSLVYLKNKKNGVTYVYESSGYWDKEKQQARNNRTCIGKLDPVTGKVRSIKVGGRKKSFQRQNSRDRFRRSNASAVSTAQRIFLILLAKSSASSRI